MRRPRFMRWIRTEVLRIAGTTSFSLRKLAAQSQLSENSELSAALLLYAHENGQYDKLMCYVYDDELAREYNEVESRLGARSIERLALRGTPMMSLPEQYRNLLARFDEAYHAPENIAREKRALWESTRKSVLVSGASPTELARDLDLDQANLSAYLSSGDTGRFTLATVRQIADYVTQLAAA